MTYQRERKEHQTNREGTYRTTVSASNILEVNPTVFIIMPNLMDLRVQSNLQVPANGSGKRSTSIERDASKSDDRSESLLEIATAQR